MDLALNNLQSLKCHKTQTNKQYIYIMNVSISYPEFKYIYIYIYIYICVCVCVCVCKFFYTVKFRRLLCSRKRDLFFCFRHVRVWFGNVNKLYEILIIFRPHSSSKTLEDNFLSWTFVFFTLIPTLFSS